LPGHLSEPQNLDGERIRGKRDEVFTRETGLLHPEAIHC
jgi:hypothetical protein